MAARPLQRRDLLRLGGKALALGSLFLAGCARDEVERPTSSPTAVPSSSVTPGPPPEVILPSGPDEPNAVVIEVIEDVPEDQVIVVRHAAELARDFYFRKLGFHVDGPVRINLINSPDLPIHAVTFLPEGESISSITVNVGQASWQVETPLERTKVVAHEYFHVLQTWLRGTTDTSADPLFLVEGSAEYAGYASVIDGGDLTLPELRQSLIGRLRRQRIRLPVLDRLTDEGSFAFAGYALAALAIDMLVGPRGIAPLAKYTLIRRDESVPRSFEVVFGRPLQAFYADFDVWRKATGI